MLNMIAGFLPPSGGEILVDGRAVSGPGPGPRRRVPVLRAVSVAHRARQRRLRPEDARRAQGRARTRSRASTSRSPACRTRPSAIPNELSGGMQQRVGVVRALANEPDVLLMDEPFASVDAQTRMTLQEELTRIWQERRPTVLFITHDVAEAVFLANRVVVLSQGHRARRRRHRPAAAARLGRADRGRRLQGAVGARAAAGALGMNARRTLAMGTDPRRRCARRAAGIVLGCDRRLLLWQVWLMRRRAAARSRRASSRNARGQVNVLVTLRFTPERFHVLEFQQHGRVSGTQDDVDRGARRQDRGPERRRPALLGQARGAAARRMTDQTTRRRDEDVMAANVAARRACSRWPRWRSPRRPRRPRRRRSSS